MQSRKFCKVLEKCDLAIIDFPSSSIIEANKANIERIFIFEIKYVNLLFIKRKN